MIKQMLNLILICKKLKFETDAFVLLKHLKTFEVCFQNLFKLNLNILKFVIKIQFTKKLDTYLVI